jgi:hypothetical protein
MPDITTASSAYATESCQIIHAEAFIAERRYRQLLIAAQAYKLHVLQSRRKAQQAKRDIKWFNNCASAARAGAGYNPEWCAHHGMDGARPFPGVPFNTDNGISRHIFLLNYFLNVAVCRCHTWPTSTDCVQREFSFQINKSLPLTLNQSSTRRQL